MKILSNKKYNELIERLEELEFEYKNLKSINEGLNKKLQSEKTDCTANKGKSFCSCCVNSYKYTDYYGSVEVERYGCLLDIPCESFYEKESR